MSTENELLNLPIAVISAASAGKNCCDYFCCRKDTGLASSGTFIHFFLNGVPMGPSTQQPMVFKTGTYGSRVFDALIRRIN
jgi:hypothetical protein